MLYKLITISVILFSGFTTCLLGQENTALLCSDGIDNDGDGLIDCNDNECVEIPTDGCEICKEGLSFADFVIEYESGCQISDVFPDGALGVSDYNGFVTDEPEFVFLGEGGFIKLQFNDNLLSNSSDSQDDLYVFEVGTLVEPMTLSLRPIDSFTIGAMIAEGFQDIDLDGFYEVISLGGATTSIDIDNLIPGYQQGQLVFDAVELRDIADRPCMGMTPGADIDAVCALFFLPLDCAGVVDGTSEIDQCGECLEPTDPDFDQSCLDCAGVVDGTSEIDICGECLEPTDPDFDQSCVDCAGVVNGESILDDCGNCLFPSDPNFVSDCLKEKEVYIPNVMSIGLSNDDLFRIFPKSENFVNQILFFRIYDRWGNIMYEEIDNPFKGFTSWWDGTYNGKELDSAHFTYQIELSYMDQSICSFVGSITLLK